MRARRQKARYVFALGIATALGLGATAETPVTIPVCPPAISVTQTISGPVPAGWSVMKIPVVHDLSRVGILEGDLVDNGELVPETQELAIFTSMNVWDIVGIPGPFWIGCSYLGTRLELYGSLPPGVASCQETVSADEFDIVTCAPAH